MNPATDTREAKSSDLIQGTLEMLILKTLALEPMHGYGVGLRIEQISGGVFKVNAGSLLPALSRMERGGDVKSEWRATEKNRRAKYYLLTAKGRQSLSSGNRTMAAPDWRDRTHSRSLTAQTRRKRGLIWIGSKALPGELRRYFNVGTLKGTR